MGGKVSKRRAAKAARSAKDVAAELSDEAWIDAKVWQMVWAVFLYPNVPRDIEVLKPKARHWEDDTDRKILFEVGIVGASDYLKIWVNKRPVAFIILACGGSVKLLEEVSGKKPTLTVGYRKLANLDRAKKPLTFEGGRVSYSGEVWFVPFNQGKVRSDNENIWLAYGFGENGRRRITDRDRAHRRRREDPLTVVSLDWKIEDDQLVIRMWTEHEYPHHKRHLDRIVFTEEVVRIRLTRDRKYNTQ